MFARCYNLYSLSPSYFLASQSRRQRRAKSGGPQSPSDTLTLLNSDNPLFFRQISYRRNARIDDYILEDAIKGAEFHHYKDGRLSVADEHLQHSLAELLFVLNGAAGAFYCGSYIGAILCRHRTGRNELAIVVSSRSTPDQYYTITIPAVPHELHLRFAFGSRTERKVKAADFHLGYNLEHDSMEIRIREHWNIHEDPEANPWIIRDGVSVYEPQQFCDCRDIYLTRFKKQSANKYLIPVREYSNLVYKSFNLS